MLTLILPFGPHAPLLLVLGVAFLPVQVTLAWAVRQGRGVAPLVALVAPAVLLGAGGVAAGAALDAAWEAVRNSAGALDDPAWIPWVALDGRARALGPIALGAGLSAFLAALPLVGAMLGGRNTAIPGAEGEPSATPPPSAVQRSRRAIVVGLLAVGGAAAGVVAGAGAFAGVPGLGGLLVLAGACAGTGALAAGAAWRASRAGEGGIVPPRSVLAPPAGGNDDDLDLDEDSAGAPPTEDVIVEDEEATVSMRASEVAALEEEDVTAPRVGGASSGIDTRASALRGAASRSPSVPGPGVRTPLAPERARTSTAAERGRGPPPAGEALRRGHPPPPPQAPDASTTHLVAACAVFLVTALALVVTASAGLPVPDALAAAARGEAAPAGGALLHADYLRRVATAGWFAAAAAGAFTVCAVPAIVHGGGARGLVHLTLTGLIGAAALAPAVSAHRNAHALASHAGAQAVAVYETAVALHTHEGTGADAGAPPEGDPLPPRVLVVSPETPRWLNLRPRGGLEALPVVPGDGVDEATLVFGGAGRSVGHGDGLLLPPDLSAIDFYLLLADSRATEVSIVTCGSLPVAASRLVADPLLATGVCGPVRVHLRRPPGARTTRSLIVLKDREVDADGDVVAIEALGEVRGPLLVRLQSDAVMSDLFALLAHLRAAGPLVLGWGVDLDGGDIPVGARP